MANFRIPEIPEDSETTNPILKRFDSDGFIEYSKVNERFAYFGLGKALLEFETAVGEMERKCKGRRLFSFGAFSSGFNVMDILRGRFGHPRCLQNFTARSDENR